MRHTRKNVVFHELIGLRVEVVEYPDGSVAGLRGRVLDETRKTLLIETDRGRTVRVFKENGTFKFLTPSGESVLVRGFEIVGSPEDRLKRVLRAGRA